MSRLGKGLHLTKHTGEKHTATVIFFHGSGSSGVDMKEWVRLTMEDFNFPHINVIYPTAPLQPYTHDGGEMSNVWFDREAVSPDAPENLQSLNNIKNDMENLFKHELESGIPINRIILGGFSMGGAFALHTAYKWGLNVAGVFAFGSFLSNQSVVYQKLENVSKSKLPPLMQIHGESDDLVIIDWGQNTFNQLKELGVQGEFHVMQELGHSINKQGMILIKEWIEKQLPELNIEG